MILCHFGTILKLLEQVSNKLLTTCYRIDGTIRFVTRLFQQDRYSHDISMLLQPCVVNFMTILLQQVVCNRLVGTTLSVIPVKLVIQPAPNLGQAGQIYLV